MKICGADFSGAMNPSRGIYYAEGSLNGSTLHIDRVVHCDDRLDLLAAIHFSMAPWGLDFPFPITPEALEQPKLNSWSDLLNLAVESGRVGYGKYLEDGGILGCEGRCRNRSICCRTQLCRLSAL